MPADFGRFGVHVISKWLKIIVIPTYGLVNGQCSGCSHPLAQPRGELVVTHPILAPLELGACSSVVVLVALVSVR